MDRDPAEQRRRVGRALSLAARGAAAVGLAVGLAALIWTQAIRGDLLRVHAIRFEGLSRTSAEELLELSPVRTGDHLLACDTALMEAALRRHPWVAQVEVRRSLPPALEVTVTERRAAAVVDLGGLYLVDATGEVFKRARAGDGLDLPVISGVSRDDWLERRGEVVPTLRAALALLDRWRERGLDRRAPVSEIHVDAEYGTRLWAGPDGLEVRLGHGSIPEKLERLERVLAAVAAEGRRAEVLHLDNRRRPDWVAVRLAGLDGGGGGGGAVGSLERPRGR